MSRITPCSIWLTSSGLEFYFFFFFFLRQEYFSGFLFLNIYNDLSFFTRKTITALDPNWLKFFHLTTWGLFLSEKTRKSNRLQMSLERQHFLLSIKRPPPKCWSGRCVEPATCRSADRRLSSWANRRAKTDQSWLLRNIGPVI